MEVRVLSAALNRRPVHVGRFINTGRKGWRHPRYSFSNVSDDIRGIFCMACDLIGVRYTHAPRTVYVSRKADVVRLDEFIGPKA